MIRAGTALVDITPPAVRPFMQRRLENVTKPARRRETKLKTYTKGSRL